MEKEKQELMKFERERLEREKDELERLRRQQASRLDEARRATKRPGEDRDPYYEDRKRTTREEYSSSTGGGGSRTAAAHPTSSTSSNYDYNYHGGTAASSSKHGTSSAYDRNARSDTATKNRYDASSGNAGGSGRAVATAEYSRGGARGGRLSRSGAVPSYGGSGGKSGGYTGGNYASGSGGAGDWTRGGIGQQSSRPTLPMGGLSMGMPQFGQPGKIQNKDGIPPDQDERTMFDYRFQKESTLQILGGAKMDYSDDDSDCMMDKNATGPISISSLSLEDQQDSSYFSILQRSRKVYRIWDPMPKFRHKKETKMSIKEIPKAKQNIGIR